MCSVWISEQTSIISLYSSNWSVFITEMECVYYAVRAGSLNRSLVILVFQPCHGSGGWSPAFPREGPVSIPGQSWAICVSQRGTGADFSPSTAFGFLQSVSCHAPYSFSTKSCSFQKDDKWTNPGKLPKSNGQKNLSFFFVFKCDIKYTRAMIWQHLTA